MQMHLHFNYLIDDFGLMQLHVPHPFFNLPTTAMDNSSCYKLADTNPMTLKLTGKSKHSVHYKDAPP